MALSFDETRKLLDAIDAKIERLEKIKDVFSSKPQPVLRDKHGRLTKNYTLKLWLMKLHEEVLEFEAETQAFAGLDENPVQLKELYTENKELIAGEACDIITVLYGICRQFGIDENFMDTAMLNTYEKNRGRGYFEGDEGGDRE